VNYAAPQWGDHDELDQLFILCRLCAYTSDERWQGRFAGWSRSNLQGLQFPAFPDVVVFISNAKRQAGCHEREVFAEVPPRVEYRLTPRGRALGQAVCGMWTWAARHAAAVQESRRAYDARHRLGARAG
jgi:hypothetical protein